MYIDSRFIDFYDWELNVSQDRKDTVYKREFKQRGYRGRDFIIAVGNQAISLRSQHSSRFYQSFITSLDKNLEELVNVSGHFIIQEKLDGDFNSLTEKTGELTVSLGMKRLLESPYIKVQKVQRSQFNYSDAPVFLAYDNRVLENFSFLASGIDACSLFGLNGLEIATEIDNFVSQMYEEEVLEIEDKFKIVGKGFDLKSSFRH